MYSVRNFSSRNCFVKIPLRYQIWLVREIERAPWVRYLQRRFPTCFSYFFAWLTGRRREEGEEISMRIKAPSYSILYCLSLFLVFLYRSIFYFSDSLSFSLLLFFYMNVYTSAIYMYKCIFVDGGSNGVYSKSNGAQGISS